MSKQTEKKRYPSKYSEGFLTAAQYIVEIVCEHKAFVDRQKLKEQFWKDPLWEKFYKLQMIAANGLLRTYREEAIISALKSKKASRTYSLRATWLDDIIKEEQHKIELSEKIQEEKAKQPEVVVKPVESKPAPSHRKVNGNKSLFSILREEDGKT